MNRPLTTKQIADLQSFGCTASDWSAIDVDVDFDASRLSCVHFSGKVSLGKFVTSIDVGAGILRQTGIRNAAIDNCTVGDDCLIENIAGYISRYNIARDCYISNIDLLSVEGKTSFGNGVKVSVMCESGGREVVIFDGLSSQLAYIMAIYRYKTEQVAAIERLVNDYVSSVQSHSGYIGPSCKIVNCGSIKNVKIGPHATISGAAQLVNGSINSSAAAPVYVGVNVIASDFILSSGVVLDKAATLSRVFVGQGSIIANLFSAHDSLFFANCHCENGEACAIFAGPYTVTMHKSSLLIAGIYSFLNAGSGSNQSNHMYKLGPIHQGIVERGSKTTSDSYILWPARIGAFSLVMGRHTSHSDTSDMPFSYLIERDDRSHLSPGVNLKSVGTLRDTLKWPLRDRRCDSNKTDLINFNLLSPYTISRMMRAVDILRKLEISSGIAGDHYFYFYQGTQISRSALERGKSLYAMAVNKFFGNSILKKLENVALSSDEDLVRALYVDQNDKLSDKWVDLAGFFAPQSAIDAALADVCDGKLSSIAALEQRFGDLHQQYYQIEWRWAQPAMQQWWGVDMDSITAVDVRRIAGQWIDSVLAIDKMLIEDARKEFSLVARVGFGVDGNDGDISTDFKAVRGLEEQNEIIATINRHIDTKSRLYDDLMRRLQDIN